MRSSHRLAAEAKKAREQLTREIKALREQGRKLASQLKSTLGDASKREQVPKERAWLAMVYASTACTPAVELLYKANRDSSVFTGNTFDRRLRDIQSANQHTTVSLKTWEVIGRVLLGLEPNYGLLFLYDAKKAKIRLKVSIEPRL
jgi:hypothetical protein